MKMDFVDIGSDYFGYSGSHQIDIALRLENLLSPGIEHYLQQFLLHKPVCHLVHRNYVFEHDHLHQLSSLFFHIVRQVFSWSTPNDTVYKICFAISLLI